MDKSYFIEVLRKYLQGNATKEEYQFLVSYYDLFEAEPDISGLWSEKQKEELKEQMHATIWRNIHIRDKQKRERPIYGSWLMKAAAVAIVVGFTASIFYLINDSASEKTQVAQIGQHLEHRVIRLSDGSTVIVKAGSKLDYPSFFEGLAKREVYLEGQAYFDVKYNSEKPFIVHTGSLYTTVLGTAFNIKAYPGDVDITVTVKRGKVKVSNQNETLGIIAPDQQITYHKQDNTFIRQTVSSSVYLAWKEEDLLFDDVTVAEAAELLEERFKVSISFSNDLIRSKRFTTTFLKGESLEQVLKSICEFNDAVYDYDIERASVIISSK